MEKYRVRPGSEIDLASWATDDAGSFAGSKKDARRRLKELGKEIAELQRVLWAQSHHKLLVVLQAMDTGGKDGTIRRVFGRSNPQGVRVANFKAPTRIELAHDYLWRVHAQSPATGEIVVFNRSHYEDVLIVRVLGLVPQERWQRRYDHIAAFEQLLADEGTTILKFYLHISKERQRERLQARLDDPDKLWKFNRGDLDHRALWPEYMEAYRDAIVRTSTEDAPWFIVPSDRKWYRNLVVAETVAATLRGLDLAYPPAEDDLDGITIP
jgi:PPK2 family polyphosphate:nucleotide phosphotransferase